jgi:hypothetical protein
MKRIDLAFLLLAAASLVTGVTMGIAMSASHDFSLSPVHAHLNLLGWTSLALFGLVHRAYPQLAEQRFAMTHLALAGPSALMLPLGIFLAIRFEQPALAIAASFLWLAGCLIFLGQLVSLALSARHHDAQATPGAP